MLESLAAGTPMVATPVGDNAVVLAHVDGGLVTQGFDVDDIARRLAWAYAERDRLAARARDAARHFSLEARVNRIVALGEETVAAGRRAS